MTDGAGATAVGRANESASRGEWKEACELLTSADAEGLLGPGDLPLLAEIAYAAGHLDVTIEVWERAYAAFIQAGDNAAAAGSAVRLAMHLLFDTALMAPVRGWLGRAERLLDGEGGTPAHAWFAVVRAYERILTGDTEGARQWARRAVDVGSDCDAAACAIGRVAEARLLILDGDVVEGLALLDEAGVATVSGELDPLSTGVVFCELVCALQGLALYDVAEEWTEAMERWCVTNAIGSLHGRCRVHRAEILRLRGECDAAESQALMAVEELRPYLRRELGWPLNELGRIRLHKGDIAGAEEALLAAHGVGWIPSPVWRWCGRPKVTSPPRRRRYEMRSSVLYACRPRSAHPTRICSGPRCSRRRWRSTRGRRCRSGSNRRRCARVDRRSVRQHGAARERGPRTRTGATRGGRRRRGRGVTVGRGASVVRRRGSV